MGAGVYGQVRYGAVCTFVPYPSSTFSYMFSSMCNTITGTKITPAASMRRRGIASKPEVIDADDAETYTYDKPMTERNFGFDVTTGFMELDGAEEYDGQRQAQDMPAEDSSKEREADIIPDVVNLNDAHTYSWKAPAATTPGPSLLDRAVVEPLIAEW